MTHDEMIAVIQAHKDGKVIQARHKQCPDEWGDVVKDTTCWDFLNLDYRVKPEPREVWISSTGKGLGDFYYKSREECLTFHHGTPVCFREVLD